jgi:hypothetical protein
MIRGIPRRSKYLLTNRYGKQIDRNLVSRQLRKFRERYPEVKEFSVDQYRAACIYWRPHGELER